ncbi:hypothetical protein GCM10022234_17910 [Aeromicrobium panaciterrae]
MTRVRPYAFGTPMLRLPSTRPFAADLHGLVRPPAAGYDRWKRDADHARGIAARPTTPVTRRFHRFDSGAETPQPVD